MAPPIGVLLGVLLVTSTARIFASRRRARSDYVRRILSLEWLANQNKTANHYVLVVAV